MTDGLRGPHKGRKTVLQLVPALESGGVERGVLEVADALVHAGYRSIVISEGGRLVDTLVRGGSEHFESKLGRKSLAAVTWIAWLRRFVLKESIDLIDFHSRVPGWIALAAWSSLPRNNRPVLVSSLHGLHSVNLYSSIMCRGQWVIAVSNTVRDYIRENFPKVPEERIRVIHRGIDAGDFPRGFQPSHEWMTQWNRDHAGLSGKKLITLVGRVTRLKGHSDLVRMIGNLRADGNDVQGLIVGGVDPRKADYLRSLEAEIEASGLSEHIHFLGERRDLKEIYSISDCVVSLSRTPESFGRSVAEALSIGSPVVGYDHGGVGEILRAQFPLGLVSVGDIDQLTSRAAKILFAEPRVLPSANPFERQRMLDATLELYEEAMGRAV
jgi:glycosyltransferase involved in cell wall biosynthesis